MEINVRIVKKYEIILSSPGTGNRGTLYFLFSHFPIPHSFQSQSPIPVPNPSTQSQYQSQYPIPVPNPSTQSQSPVPNPRPRPKPSPSPSPSRLTKIVNMNVEVSRVILRVPGDGHQPPLHQGGAQTDQALPRHTVLHRWSVPGLHPLETD